MAELVDALVSNTNGVIRAGSIPAPGTWQKSQTVVYKLFGIFSLYFMSAICPHFPRILGKFTIESVEEMKLEGKQMHHCVGSYHTLKDALIFSAIIDGKRVETGEVFLTTMKVVQRRGVCNSNTECHDRIVALVERHIDLIRQRMEQRR